jgi:hypothetical protein
MMLRNAGVVMFASIVSEENAPEKTLQEYELQ